jgi:hypothetical protein
MDAARVEATVRLELGKAVAELGPEAETATVVSTLTEAAVRIAVALQPKRRTSGGRPRTQATIDRDNQVYNFLTTQGGLWSVQDLVARLGAENEDLANPVRVKQCLGRLAKDEPPRVIRVTWREWQSAGLPPQMQWPVTAPASPELTAEDAVTDLPNADQPDVPQVDSVPENVNPPEATESIPPTTATWV